MSRYRYYFDVIIDGRREVITKDNFNDLSLTPKAGAAPIISDLYKELKSTRYGNMVGIKLQKRLEI